MQVLLNMKTDKPNILFISTDQLAAKWMEFAIDSGLTPNIACLYEKGVGFTNAFTNNPICMPARSSTITGKATAAHGVWNNDGKSLNPKRLLAFPELLRRNGYRTGGYGKFHFEPFWDGLCQGVGDFGFDEYGVSEDMRYGPWLEWVREKSPEHYEKALASVWHWHIPEHDSHRNSAGLKQDIHAAYERYLEPHIKKHGGPPYPDILPKDLSQSAWISEMSCQFIERNSIQEAPFFLYASFVGPHAPCVPSEEYLGLVDSLKLPDIVEPDVDSMPWNIRNMLKKRPVDDWDLWKKSKLRERKYYLAYLAMIDDMIGRILSSLDENGVADNTYILFSSDHGDMLGDHGLWDKGGWHYDACIRIPLVLIGPNVEKRKSEALVNNLDIAPTFLELAGIEPAVISPDGQSLLKILKEDSDQREDVFVESYGLCLPAFPERNSPETWAFTLRSQQYRYTWYPFAGTDQLFDMQNDPDEVNNLASDEKYKDLINSKRLRLKEIVYWLNLD